MKTENLQRIANLLVKIYAHEIVRDGDWWFGADDFDINIHNWDETNYYRINVYTRGVDGLLDYSTWIDLEPAFIGEHILTCQSLDN